jgi:UDP-3-O-[3-hydroxymyristoyl] N-acetylglucosamine deacetylase
MNKQKTIAKEVKIQGTGLHSGAQVELSLKPAPADSGIVFMRLDIKPHIGIKAHISNIGSCERSTTLQLQGIQVRTIEHFLAAVYALGIDNLLIELNAPELPALDGSAGVFLQCLQSAGLLEQEKAVRPFILKEALWYKEKEALIFALPAETFKLNYLAYFAHPQIGAQWLEFDFKTHDFALELAPARTFAFWEELEALKAKKLGLGGDLTNAFVIKQDGYLGERRFPDEVVRHKALDFIGDLKLLGQELTAEVYAFKTSHKINVEFVKKLANAVAST